MADTDFDLFSVPPVPALEATDIGLFKRGAGGINVLLSALAHKQSDGRFHMDAGADVSGDVRAGDGSVAAPAFRFLNDPDTGIFRHTADTLSFAAGGVERVKIEGLDLVTVWAAGADSRIGMKYTDGSSYFLGMRATEADRQLKILASAADSSGFISFLTGTGVERLRITTDGNVRPGSDNAIDLASGSFRFQDLFLVNSPTVSSDARSKKLRGDGAPTPEEIAWAKAIRPKAYQLLASIEAKGGEARIHWGVLAQDVHQAGIDAGVADPFRHGFLGRDPITTRESRRVKVERQKVEIVTETVAEVELRAGGPVLVRKEVERERPMFEDAPLHDERGRRVTIEAEAGDVPATHPVPIMETVEEMQEVDVPLLDEDGAPAVRWNIRYEELIMFLWACGALFAAEGE